MGIRVKKVKFIFIAGCGDIGLRVGRLWLARGLPVAALARSEASADRLKEAGISVVRGDLDDPVSLTALSLSEAIVYYFAPPPAKGTGDARMLAFTENAPLSERVVYISTSAVYGDHGGDGIDEETPPMPCNEWARRRLDAEMTLRAWGRQEKVPVVILRVAGIYGPGRWPLERLRKGVPVLRPEECGYSNRIHADDLARIAVAAAERGGADRVYNVSDGSCSTLSEYFFAVADHFGFPRPRTLTLAEGRQIFSPMMLSYFTESRRMDNRRLVQELKVELRFPDLAAGLSAASIEEGAV